MSHFKRHRIIPYLAFYRCTKQANSDLTNSEEAKSSQKLSKSGSEKISQNDHSEVKMNLGRTAQFQNYLTRDELLEQGGEDLIGYEKLELLRSNKTSKSSNQPVGSHQDKLLDSPTKDFLNTAPGVKQHRTEKVKNLDKDQPLEESKLYGFSLAYSNIKDLRGSSKFVVDYEKSGYVEPEHHHAKNRIHRQESDLLLPSRNYD